MTRRTNKRTEAIAAKVARIDRQARRRINSARREVARHYPQIVTAQSIVDEMFGARESMPAAEWDAEVERLKKGGR